MTDTDGIRNIMIIPIHWLPDAHKWKRGKKYFTFIPWLHGNKWLVYLGSCGIFKFYLYLSTSKKNYYFFKRNHQLITENFGVVNVQKYICQM